MNGLGYILMLNNMQHYELANKLGIKKQRIDRWTIGDNIPLNYNESFLKLFNVPITYLTGELTKKNLTYILSHIKNYGEMIGFAYILKVYNIQSQELAEKLGINSTNINMWRKEIQSIPQKYLPILSEIFNVPIKYFKKVLVKEDMEYLNRININMKLDNIIVDPERNITVSLPMSIFNKLGDLSEYELITSQQLARKIIIDYLKGI